VNTSDPQFDGGGYLGAALLGLDTRGASNVFVAWRAGTLIPNSRAYAIRLQFRVGLTNAFGDLLDFLGQPVEYLRHPIPGHSAMLGPFSLPPECREQPYVQLRWKYYWVSGTSGARAALRLDDIVVSPAAIRPGDAHLSFLGAELIRLEYAGVTGLRYVIESSTNLIEWTEVATVPASANGALEWIGSIDRAEPAHFYRLRWP